MYASAPWRLAVTSAVGILAGAALLSVEWTLAPLAVFAGYALAVRGALHLVSAARLVGFGGAFAALSIAGDVGVGVTAIAWPEPTRLTLALLIGAWTILRAIAGGTIAVTTRVDAPWYPLSIVFASIAGVLGTILVARSDASVRDTSVIIGLVALVEGTRELSEAALGDRQARRLRRAARERPEVATLSGD
jgi:uncharacterized membrane protein HdeD (DUF308 family)